MKIVKIILPVAVIAILGFFIWKWLVVIDPPKEITPPINPFTAKIESEIDSLKQMPTNVFCQKYYANIQYRINDYQKNGFLGKSDNDNNQWQEILSKNLYSAYAPKFVEQAKFVFSNSEWENEDLLFIRSEVVTLNSSPFLDASSPVAKSFNSISSILAKYDEINGFISSCNGFSHYNYALENSFPDVSEMIQESRAYLTNNLNNPYLYIVLNNLRIKDRLEEVPKNLFDKHINYLQRKINRHGGRHTEFDYQSGYSRIIYTPLRNQTDELSNETYPVSDNSFDIEYNSLDNLLKTYNRKATDYFFKIWEKGEEIEKFISSCNNFSPSNYRLDSKFPNVSYKIQKSQAYLTNNNNNPYLNIVLNNDPQIKKSLKEVPKKLFDKHVSFLQIKIKEHGGRYKEFISYSEYSRIIYEPLKYQIDDLDKETYDIGYIAFDNGYKSLGKLLKKFNDEAINYYKNPNKKLIRQLKRKK